MTTPPPQPVPDDPLWRRAVAAMRRVGGTQRFNGIMCVFGALMFAGLAAYSSDRDDHLGPGSPVTEATVVDIVHSLGKKQEDVVVEFTTPDGQRVRAKTEEFMFSPYPEVGSTVTIRYDPEQPQEYVRDVRFGGNRIVTVICAAFSVLFAVGAVLGLRGRLPAWVLSIGR